jgi:hypothetical protein
MHRIAMRPELGALLRAGFRRWRLAGLKPIENTNCRRCRPCLCVELCVSLPAQKLRQLIINNFPK